MLADPEKFGKVLNAFDTGGVAELVEKTIARNLERVRQSEGSMGTALFRDPALKVTIAVGHSAGTIIRSLPEAFF